MRLILVRHGNTFEKGAVCTHVGRSDMPLTSEGLIQARRVGRHLRQENFIPSAVYSGSLSRQRQTAQAISEELCSGRAVQSGVSALDEVDYGPWEGLTTEQIIERWPAEYTDWIEAGVWPEGIIPGSSEQRIEAIRKFVDELLAVQDPDDKVIAVSSNGVLRYFNALIPGKWEALCRDRRVKELKVATGAFCELLFSGDNIEIVSWNTLPSI